MRLRGLRSPLSLLTASLTSSAGCELPLPSLPHLPVLHSNILHLISYIITSVNHIILSGSMKKDKRKEICKLQYRIGQQNI